MVKVYKPVPLQCNYCKQIYPATIEFFPPHKDCRYGFEPRCRPCVRKQVAQYRETNIPFQDVSCKDCNILMRRRIDSLKNWKGRCRSCAQKFEKNKPEMRASASQKAREQVLRQGGIPNARKFAAGRPSEEHWKWKGGITPQTMKIRQSDAYKQWRTAVFQRDEFTCQICKVEGGILNADHYPTPFTELFQEFQTINIDAENFVKFWDINNGRTLCVTCHRLFGWSLFKHNNPRKKELIN